jgi:hypothetical protein
MSAAVTLKIELRDASVFPQEGSLSSLTTFLALEWIHSAPGVHLPGRGGVRIDDTLVVRPEADGGPELLTITTKELLAL